jgi:hypothetical protein
LKTEADSAAENASSHWREVRGKWQAHVAEVRSRVSQETDRIDAGNAAIDTDLTRAYAYDAIDFALDAIEEAENAVLTALYARANTQALRT